MPVNVRKNRWRGRGLPQDVNLVAGEIETDVGAARALYEMCPVKDKTPLLQADALANRFGVAELWLKIESGRMGLGSFKALGAAHAIAKQAVAQIEAQSNKMFETALNGRTFICASAGNHGLSVAAGARLFGARAVIYLAETVPFEFAARLEAKGADVVVEGKNYEASMAAAAKAAQDNDWLLLSDSSWSDYAALPRDVMEGYLIAADEVAREIPQPPTHVFLQAGVGGFAAACAAVARRNWGDDVVIAVVEPESAPALAESVEAGRCVDTTGPVSSMGRLDCKTPSHLALKYLAREADWFVTLDDDLVEQTVLLLADENIATTPSGGAGVAGLHHVGSEAIGLDPTSRVLCFISEGG